MIFQYQTIPLLTSNLIIFIAFHIFFILFCVFCRLTSAVVLTLNQDFRKHDDVLNMLIIHNKIALSLETFRRTSKQ